MVQSKAPRKRSVRFGSPLSTAATLGDPHEAETDRIYDEETQEIDEISDWLLQAEPPSPTTCSKEIEAPFSIFGVPGPLLFHLIHIVLIYLNLLPAHLPTHAFYPMTLPRRSTPRPPHIPDYLRSRNPFRPQVHDDDTEYVVAPKPGTNQYPLSIAVTTDISLEKINTHHKGMLRIYRVPTNDERRQFFEFGFGVQKAGLFGMSVRPPVDEDDTVAVFRHGFRSWDFGASRKEVWFLVATDSVVLREVIARCEYRPPPFLRRVTKPLRWTTRRLFSLLLPWIYPPELYQSKQQHFRQVQGF